jgi:hypothetical protein
VLLSSTYIHIRICKPSSITAKIKGGIEEHKERKNPVNFLGTFSADKNDVSIT